MIGGADDWLAKARDDLSAVELLMRFEEYPLAVAAFHCQQAVEKSLKAFLTYHYVEFLFKHDLGYLLDLCCSVEPECARLEPYINGLTPFAVEMRYPVDLPVIPSSEDIHQFFQQAQFIFEFVVKQCTL